MCSVIVAVDVKIHNLKDSTHSVDTLEDRIVSEYNRLYSDLSGTRLQAIVKKTQELDEELQSIGAGIELITLKKQNSIGSYFWCSTSDSLQQLRQAYKSGALKQALENIFNILIRDVNKLVFDRVQLQLIVWAEQVYQGCAVYFTQYTS